MHKRRYLLVLAFIVCLNLSWGISIAYASNILLSSRGGFPGQRVEFGLLLTNDEQKTHSYSLQAKGLPEHYGTEFYLDKKVVSNVELRPQQKENIALQVSIPDSASPNNYEFAAVIVRDDGFKTALPLSLTVDDSYLLKIAGATSNLTVLSGKDANFQVSLINNGQKELNKIQPVLELPYKWQVSVNPKQVDRLKPGETADFNVKVLVPATQDASNQKIIVSGKADKASTQLLTIPAQVQKSANYLFIPVIAVAVVMVAAAITYKKRGRR